MTEPSSLLTNSLSIEELHRAFPDLPADARLWIYGTDRELSDEEIATLHGAFEEFAEAWDSHGKTVHAALTIVERRFLIIAAHVENGDISGCGIDKQVHHVEEVGTRLGVMWSPALSVFYRDATGKIRAVSRTVFRERVARREISGTTLVFDPAAAYVADLREKRFARPARESWHRRIFNIPD